MTKIEYSSLHTNQEVVLRAAEQSDPIPAYESEVVDVLCRGERE